ncbi:hypothetical protein BGZ82_005979, partial [Podila clonocystis]
MVKYGVSTWIYKFPALETLKILWGYDPKAFGSRLSGENIGSLVDKSIAYFQRLSPRRREENLLPSETTEIAKYLEIQV